MGPRNASGGRTRRRDRSTAKSLPATTPPPNAGKCGSEADVLRKLYFSILRCQCLEEHARRWLAANHPARRHDVAPWQHVIAAATTFELFPADTLAAPPSHLAAYIARSTSLKQAMENVDIRAEGGLRRPGLDPTCASLRASNPLTFGTAAAVIHKLEKQPHVVLALLDGDLGAAPVEATLKLAYSQRLPIVYVAGADDKNSTSAQAAEQFEPVSFAAKGCRIPGILVDGEDAVALWRVTQEAIHRARIGSGPTFIECARNSSPPQDPLVRLQHHMQRRGAWDDGWRQQIRLRLDREVEEALPQL